MDWFRLGQHKLTRVSNSDPGPMQPDTATAVYTIYSSGHVFYHYSLVPNDLSLTHFREAFNKMCDAIIG